MPSTIYRTGKWSGGTHRMVQGLRYEVGVEDKEELYMLDGSALPIALPEA